ncbi:MAG: gamma-glutamyltransferase, partial [Sandaracinobacter sp.]
RGWVPWGDRRVGAWGFWGALGRPRGRGRGRGLGQGQVLVNIIDLGMNLQAAGDAPRMRHMGSPDPGADGKEPVPGVFLESGIGAETRAALVAKGHVLVEQPQDVGGYQAVMWDAANKVWWGATAMRKDGVALGY